MLVMPTRRNGGAPVFACGLVGPGEQEGRWATCRNQDANFLSIEDAIHISRDVSQQYMVGDDKTKFASDIGSREPNYAVFQQNPIAVTTQLDAPMDSDAVIAAA